ncbi:hypothetical protein MKQ68_07980 [Chitinophaga horti]|uniref:WG repeat-containing protein n=1 Tax=Chitinophaga horti TaxID=2920382 RepID=A0ABY6J5S8_9BACT|nr:hypothetical protein [Chitinophaga horti]UYQ95031.1 hypothetical protein MKQ68_07980 [Chitinophaga horti]
MRYLLFLLLLSSAASAQKSLKDIPLPCAIAHRNHEYSGMAAYRDRIILMPQYPARYIYAIDTAYINDVLDGRTPKDTLYELRFENLYPVLARLKGYQGVEGCVVVRDQLFMTVETEFNDSGYVIKGHIRGKKIWMDTTHIIALPKLKKAQGKPLSEAGHESITYLPEQNKLLVMFEFNHFAEKSTGWLIDTALTTVKTIPVQPFDFRITDMHEKDGRLYGINYNYHGEFEEYEPAEKLMKPNGKYADWDKDCVARIIQLEVQTNGIKVKPIAPFTFNCDNWEGMLQYRQGALLITDQHPVTRLVYLPF